MAVIRGGAPVADCEHHPHVLLLCDRHSWFLMLHRVTLSGVPPKGHAIQNWREILALPLDHHFHREITGFLE